MMFGQWGTKDHDQSVRIIHRALDADVVHSPASPWVIVGKDLTGVAR